MIPANIQFVNGQLLIENTLYSQEKTATKWLVSHPLILGKILKFMGSFIPIPHSSTMSCNRDVLNDEQIQVKLLYLWTTLTISIYIYFLQTRCVKIVGLGAVFIAFSLLVSRPYVSRLSWLTVCPSLLAASRESWIILGRERQHSSILPDQILFHLITHLLCPDTRSGSSAGNSSQPPVWFVSLCLKVCSECISCNNQIFN